MRRVEESRTMEIQGSRSSDHEHVHEKLEIKKKKRKVIFDVF